MSENSNELPATPLLQSPSASAAITSTSLPFDEEAKLVYGVVISLRNMIKKLSGRYVIFPSSVKTTRLRIVPQKRAICQLPHLRIQASLI